MGLDIFSALMDSYDRKARLNPVLLAIIPPVGVLVGLYAVRLQAQTALVGLLATFGIFYLLTSICRNLGKRLENSLYKSWGGKPTTQLLRHRDNTIDPITKKRYHTFLSQKIKTKFPTEDQELKKQNMADNVYSSAIEWLLGQTRDKKKFNLLFLENISYGFSRNCLGIKYIAISIALLSIACRLQDRPRDPIAVKTTTRRIREFDKGVAWQRVFLERKVPENSLGLQAVPEGP